MTSLQERETTLGDFIIGFLISAPSFYLIWTIFIDKAQFYLYLGLMFIALTSNGIGLFIAISMIVYLVALGIYNPLYALIYLIILSALAEKSEKTTPNGD